MLKIRTDLLLTNYLINAKAIGIEIEDGFFMIDKVIPWKLCEPSIP